MKINDILLEGESLGVMVAKMQQKQIAKDWNKLSTKEKVALLKKEQEEAEQRRKEYFDKKSVDEVTDKRPSYVVSTKDKPKKVKPSKDGSSPHPYQGKLVGATEAEQPKDKISARGKLNHSLVAQGHKVEKDRKKSVKRGDVKHKGQIEEGPLAKVAGAAAVLAALGMNMPSGKDTPLGKELASAAQSGDTVAAYYLDNLDSYIDADDQRTLVNLRIAYIDDSPRQDVKAYLAKKAGVNEEGVAEAGNKHSTIGKIQRGHELKKKVDKSFKDWGDAQKSGDKQKASKAFRDHERYANLERPGTWTKVKKQDVEEAGPFSYGAKQPRKGSVADLAAKKRKEQEKDKQPIEPKDQRVGTAKVTNGVEDYSPMTKDSMKADKIRSLKNLIAIAKEQGRGVRAQELELELKKLQGVAEAGPFSYGAKPPRKGSVAYNAMMKRKEQEKGKQPIEPQDQKVGTAKVTKAEEQKSMKGKDPCWKGYKMVGTKKKGGREVPNCVPGKKD